MKAIGGTPIVRSTNRGSSAEAVKGKDLWVNYMTHFIELTHNFRADGPLAKFNTMARLGTAPAFGEGIFIYAM